MRRLVLLLLVPLCACPPEPPPPDCTRTLVDTSGNMNGGFAGGVGGGVGSIDAPLGLVGVPLAVTVFAPLSACATDVLRADATLLDPDNAPLAFTVDVPVSRAGSQAAVSASFSFTPVQPGLHTLRVAFEPSLGVRSVLLQVAADGTLGLTHHVPLPAGASCTVWPLSDDTVACEERSGFISVTSVDGGITRFSGSELVVVDTVLWSIDGTTNTLERRVLEDGGVRVTNRFPGFPVMPTPALHDVDVALRYRTESLLTRVRVTPTSESLGDFAVDRFAQAPLAYFVEPDDTLYRWNEAQCFSTTCTNLNDLIGLEPGFLWRLVSTFGGSGQLSAFERPLATPASPRFSMTRPMLFGPSPQHSFERIPLWLEPLAGGRRVLVSAQTSGLTFTSWPWSEVVNVGRHHVVLTDGTGFVRVVAR